LNEKIKWWLSDYQAGFNYTVIEQAVVICLVPDTTKPTIESIKPINALYFMNKEIFALKSPFIIGKIDVNVTATDNVSAMDRVEFYTDEQLQATDRTAPYGGRGARKHSSPTPLKSLRMIKRETVTLRKSRCGSSFNPASSFLFFQIPCSFE